MYFISFAPPCPRGSLVPYKNKEQISCEVHFLCFSSLSQRQSHPIHKWGESVLRGSPYGENCVLGTGAPMNPPTILIQLQVVQHNQQYPSRRALTVMLLRCWIVDMWKCQVMYRRVLFYGVILRRGTWQGPPRAWALHWGWLWQEPPVSWPLHWG